MDAICVLWEIRPRPEMHSGAQQRLGRCSRRHIIESNFDDKFANAHTRWAETISSQKNWSGRASLGSGEQRKKVYNIIWIIAIRLQIYEQTPLNIIDASTVCLSRLIGIWGSAQRDSWFHLQNSRWRRISFNITDNVCSKIVKERWSKMQRNIHIVK
jgi:hypothetical protein